MNTLHRRSFLTSSAALASGPLVMGAAPGHAPVAIVLDDRDPVASARPVRQAAHLLQEALGRAGYTVRRCRTAGQAPKHALCIVAAGGRSPVAAGVLAAAKLAQPAAPESLALAETTVAGRRAILACGADARGLVYALTELADRVRHKVPLRFRRPVAGQPANPVRSVMRQFVSEMYDKPWYYDRAMWPHYFAMLASQRFNRFDLAFGLGYDMLRHVADPYFVFAYPFLLAVPGYDVKVTNLPDAERDRNLRTLRYISEQAVAHGLDFELGLWMHGYIWRDTPDAKYVVTGLTPKTHAAYCRDALALLLKEVPAISAVGLRVHGESGVPEGSYGFWKTVFDGVPQAGRKIEIDLHAKGINQKMIDDALATGMPVNVSPKFSAEHLGLPYHQADIRPSEIPHAGEVGKGLMTLSEGQRSFTRYGYADLLRDGRKFAVRPRIFAGTQRILASGNAAAGAAYGEAFQFCGMEGAEWMEPLTCRGRRGSSVAGIPRDGYAWAKLEPRYDWQKYEYWYRSYGRTMYDTQVDREVFQRPFGRGRRAAALRDAVEAASRILPLVTQAHSESAACDLYWPEVYWNFPMATEAPKMFWDTPSPKTFQNVTALDPQLFSSCTEFADELKGERSGKYSPFEVALWLNEYAARTAQALAVAGPATTINAMRLIIDAEVQALLGQFFAAKLRSGVYCAIHDQSGDLASLEMCLASYNIARDRWAQIVRRTRGVYAADLSVSDRFTERGQWKNWLPDIDADIRALRARRGTAASGADRRMTKATSQMALPRPALVCRHTPPTAFAPGAAVDLEIRVPRRLSSARLWYRHVTQAERWGMAEMKPARGVWHASIPAGYTASPYALQYYFEFRDGPDRAWLWPGLDKDLLNQPYYVLRRT